MEKDPFKIVLYPLATEKTMNMLAKENRVRTGVVHHGNKLNFMVDRRATKKDIKWAIEKIFSVKVKKVNTYINRDGKRAIVTLTDEYSAEDVASRVGVF